MVQKGWGKATTLSDHKYLGYKKKIVCNFRSGNNLRKSEKSLPLTNKETKGQEVSYQNSQSK